MSYKDDERKLYEKYTEVYSEYATMFEKYKINAFETHKEMCKFLEEKTGYHIQTQQIIKEEDGHNIPYFKIYFSNDNQNWNCVEDIKITDSNKMHVDFHIKVLLKKYSAVTPPVSASLDELTKIKWIDEFDKCLIYSKEWFENQLNQR